MLSTDNNSSCASGGSGGDGKQQSSWKQQLECKGHPGLAQGWYVFFLQCPWGVATRGARARGFSWCAFFVTWVFWYFSLSVVNGDVKIHPGGLE